MRWRSDRRFPHAILLDPCAGDGEAILELRRHWAASLPSDACAFRIQANEMDADRAAALTKALAPTDGATAGDAFH
ncbi:MAG: hypothetical protein GY737_25365, partial [Desulfobacteraceae bacterium]|nr:hypothetical protein [Desulfobacteraceae bacterium]